MSIPDIAQLVGIYSVLGYLLVWNIRQQISINKNTVDLATNKESDKSRDYQIIELKSKITQIENKIDALTLALTDWKQTSNAVMSQIKDLLD